MRFEIPSRWSSTILLAVEAESLMMAVEMGVKRGADLCGAELYGANLREANLCGTNLCGARNADSMRLETGELLMEFREIVVPALLEAGGHPVPDEAWTCHSWGNCPMAAAFAVTSVDDIPLFYRPRVQQFIRLFDAGLIPAPIAV